MIPQLILFQIAIGIAMARLWTDPFFLADDPQDLH